ncbi:hypothetical protein L1987_82150 [Smallanthus sonchifolius]|uniref:Uncharacterized protein n=2 Tax=Smallanthus sonchifolius TaxID=185202 RepID=A0ACB8YWN6_9ASTR|nr:hypothetical protein L1987_82148 [Smallanthus sonchifolius]KAI3688437.1 hypothetical protein L1987_82150 [Smallanthus sonchifolius]
MHDLEESTRMGEDGKEAMEQVFLNKEYTGNSILDNLSRMDSEHREIVVEEGEPEVSSDQSAKSKSFVSPHMVDEGMLVSTKLFHKDVDANVESQSKWDKFCACPTIIKGVETWGQSEQMGMENYDWENIMGVIREGWQKEDEEKGGQIAPTVKYTGFDVADNPPINFFKEFDPIVECLTKWLGSHKLKDQEVWRKKGGVGVAREKWLDVERGEYHEEEAKQRKLRKKRKVKGNNPFKISSDVHGGQKMDALENPNGKDCRRKIHVRSSKIRYLEKNILLKKVSFDQNVNIPAVPIPPLGFSKFKVGKTTGKAAENGYKIQIPTGSKMADLYKEIAVKEAKLEEIARNINKTSENSVLRNSILNMKSSKIVKFLAKLNEEGIACIDENMVESESKDAEEPVSPDQLPNRSYATMLTGIAGPVLEEKIQYYPPLVNKEGTKVAVIDAKYILQAKAEYKNVLYGVFGNATATCKLKPRSSDDRAGDSMEKTGNQVNVKEATIQGQVQQEDGFTLVTRKRWNNKPKEVTPGNNHVILAGVRGSTRVNGKNIINLQNRNFDRQGSRDRMERSNPSNDLNSSHTPSSTPRSIPEGLPKEVPVIAKGRNSKEKNTRVHVFETSNSFQLLDQEGNVVSEDIEGQEMSNMGGNQSCVTNEGWIKKQERTLNARFHESLSQDQRFEAKRFVLDRLVPLDNTLTDWPKTLLEYFRHLCSIYEFGEGSLAASRDRLHDLDQTDTLQETIMEDVESETDATAAMMKSNPPAMVEGTGNTPIKLPNTNQHQQPDDMKDAGGVSMNS